MSLASQTLPLAPSGREKPIGLVSCSRATICARAKAPKSVLEGRLQAAEFVEKKGTVATLPSGVPLRRLFRDFFHAAFRHCAEQNSCSVLFQQNSFPQRLHLASTFFSIHHSQRKRPGGDLPARIHSIRNRRADLRNSRRENGNPIQKNDR